MKRIGRATAVAALVLLAAVAAGASSVDYSVFSDGILTTYNYALTSDEAADSITSFHVYAPIVHTLINGWSDTSGWEFATDIDPETEGADIYWYASDIDADSLAYGDVLHVTMTAPASSNTIYNYVVPDFLGNWGYETYQWAGFGVFVMMPSVPVPSYSPSLTSSVFLPMARSLTSVPINFSGSRLRQISRPLPLTISFRISSICLLTLLDQIG